MVKLNGGKISGQQRTRRSFLLLEMLIGLFLVSLCALPLVQLPMKALKEEIGSAYRIQWHRCADLTFAKFKEKIYRQEISWKEIASPRKTPSVFPVDPVTISFKPIGSRTYPCKASFYSVGKKGKNGEEIRLVTFTVSFITKEKFLFFRGGKNKKNRSAPAVFTYQLLIIKPTLNEQPPLESAPTNPPKGQALG